MRIPHQAHVLITDGRKMLLFRNEGDADYPNLQAIEREEHESRPDRDEKSDAPGHVAFRGPGRSSAYEEADFHAIEETRFAGRIADRLNRRAEAGEFEALVIAADPRTLGELRRHYRKSLNSVLIGEVAKDLVKHPVTEIERLLGAAEARPPSST